MGPRSSISARPTKAIGSNTPPQRAEGEEEKQGGSEDQEGEVLPLDLVRRLVERPVERRHADDLALEARRRIRDQRLRPAQQLRLLLRGQRFERQGESRIERPPSATTPRFFHNGSAQRLDAKYWQVAAVATLERGAESPATACTPGKARRIAFDVAEETERRGRRQDIVSVQDQAQGLVAAEDLAEARVLVGLATARRGRRRAACCRYEEARDPGGIRAPARRSGRAHATDAATRTPKDAPRRRSLRHRALPVASRSFTAFRMTILARHRRRSQPERSEGSVLWSRTLRRVAMEHRDIYRRRLDERRPRAESDAQSCSRRPRDRPGEA